MDGCSCVTGERAVRQISIMVRPPVPVAVTLTMAVVLSLATTTLATGRCLIDRPGKSCLD